MPHILFVCTANICRSPVAEAILRRELHAQGLKDWSVDSVGTWAVIARPPATNSVQLLAEQGMDISSRTARMIARADMERADLILCMERGHVEALTLEFPGAAHKVYLLSEMAGGRYNIADPYGQDLHSYQQMIAEVTMLIEEGLPRIRALAEENASRRSA